MNKTDDIEGAKVGSLRRAPPTTRVSNPLNPAYNVPGAKELNGQENAFGQSSMQFNQKQMGGNAQKAEREAFKVDYAKFYDISRKEAYDLDANRLYQASKVQREEPIQPRTEIPMA